MTIAVDPSLSDQGLCHRPSGRWWIAQHTPSAGETPNRYPWDVDPPPPVGGGGSHAKSEAFAMGEQ